MCSEGEDSEEVVSALSQYGFLDDQDEDGSDDSDSDDESGGWVSNNCIYYPRRAWAATGIVVGWFVCLSVTHESAHLAATALRLQHR